MTSVTLRYGTWIRCLEAPHPYNQKCYQKKNWQRSRINMRGKPLTVWIKEIINKANILNHIKKMRKISFGLINENLLICIIKEYGRKWFLKRKKLQSKPRFFNQLAFMIKNEWEKQKKNEEWPLNLIINRIE